MIEAHEPGEMLELDRVGLSSPASTFRAAYALPAQEADEPEPELVPALEVARMIEAPEPWRAPVAWMI